VTLDGVQPPGTHARIAELSTPHVDQKPINSNSELQETDAFGKDSK
jgi:hypothetical protein